MSVIFFDTETTGLECDCCQIVELAMLIVEDGTVIEEYDRFINIGCGLPAKITRITGITDEMLVREGVSEETVARDLKDRMTPGTVMVAHNCQFDLSFVYHLLKRHYPAEADSIVKSLDWYDTVTILKDRKKFPHKLKDAVEHYGLDEVNFHRAIDDTKALYEVTKALKKERNDLKEYRNLFGYNPKYDVEGVEFEFIRYRPQRYRNYGFENPNAILPKTCD